jgi:uncharacterized membrane protein YhaH (DUF805 family)
LDLIIDYIGYGFTRLLFMLILALPTIADSVRILHDTNRSGWWHLLVLVPVIRIVNMYIFFGFKGTKSENKLGSEPLAQ